MKEALSVILILAWLLTGALWILSLIAPKTRIFKLFSERFQGRKRLTKLLLPISLAFMATGAILAPTPTAKLSYINLSKDEETISEKYAIKGKVSGQNFTLKINNNELKINDNEFSKDIVLEPGDNKISVMLTAKTDKGAYVEAYNKSYNVYFDYEGMIYAKEKANDERLASEIKQNWLGYRSTKLLGNRISMAGTQGLFIPTKIAKSILSLM